MKTKLLKDKRAIVVCGVCGVVVLLGVITSALLYYFLVYLNKPEVVLSKTFDSFENERFASYQYLYNEKSDITASEKEFKALDSFVGDVKSEVGEKSSFYLENGTSETEIFDDANKEEEVKLIRSSDKTFVSYKNIADEMYIIHDDGLSWVEIPNDVLDSGTYSKNGGDINYILGNIEGLPFTVYYDVLNEYRDEMTFFNKSDDGNHYVYSFSFSKDAARDFLLSLGNEESNKDVEDTLKVQGTTRFEITIDKKSKEIIRITIAFSEILYNYVINETVFYFDSDMVITLEDISYGEAFDVKTEIPKEDETIEYENFVRDSMLLIGDYDAEVTVSEYVSMSKDEPFGRKFQLYTYPEIKKQFIDNGKVRFSMKPMYLAMYPNDRWNYEAFLCGFELDIDDKFLRSLYYLSTKYISHKEYVLYFKDFEDNLSSQYENFDELTKKNLYTCVQERKYKDIVDKLLHESEENKLTGSPYFIISNNSGYIKYLKGAHDYTIFEKAFNDALKGEKGGEKA